MSIFITSLNSGSNGNCYYIGNNENAVLIDAGLSCRETERRMHQLGLSMHRVKAIFISHEHTDHISGLRVLSQKYRLPVYITAATLGHSRLALDPSLVKSFRAEEPVQIADLCITAFVKPHDAAEPHSFIVQGSAMTIGVFTDIGQVCDRLSFYFSQCHAAFLETNYDEEMLQNGAYPHHLKNRIRGGNGHLSNSQALELFRRCRPAFMSHLLLSHLSKDNNRPELVKSLFETCADGVEIIVASRYGVSPVLELTGTMAHTLSKPGAGMLRQLSLFE